MMNYQAVLTLAKPFAGFPQNTILGHLHLHVANLKLATQYYQQTLGYDLIQHYGDSAAFLSTAGYHHHLGINTWKGLNLDIKNPLTTGLIGYQIHGATSKQFFDIAGLRVLIRS
jgi:catechol 2,3-dioxygenase